MNLVHMEDTENKYVWKCSFCYKIISPTKSSILGGLSIKRFDTALTLWMMNARTSAAARMIAHKARFVASPSADYFHIFRKAFSHYTVKNVLPYLVLDGPIEIDESKVNHKKF